MKFETNTLNKVQNPENPRPRVRVNHVRILVFLIIRISFEFRFSCLEFPAVLRPHWGPADFRLRFAR